MKYFVAPGEKLEVDIEPLKPCPKCGKLPSQKYGIRYAPKYMHIHPYAVCCGGEGCCFYISGETLDEAITKWNAEFKER